jgi:hypothetical protein
MANGDHGHPDRGANSTQECSCLIHTTVATLAGLQFPFLKVLDLRTPEYAKDAVDAAFNL